MSTALSNELERRKLVRLRVRADLGITPQKYEGKTHYVVKDPVSLRYYRFNEQEYFVVKHFDGKHTLEDAQKDFERQFRPHRLTFEDLEAFAQQLLQAGLVQHETAQAGKTLYDKRRKQRRLQRIATISNILYIKLPIFDPDKILTRMLRYLSWIFTWWFFAASLALMAAAVLLVLTHFATFYKNLPEYHEFFQWNTFLYLWIALGVVKVIHEFGHGLSCKAFGGECHEMGALFLCLSPCLYCNVSDSWTLPSKWKRIIISFAGIYVELVIAALATFVWWNAQNYPTLRHISLCVMVLCSVSTVVFNANPLMRFDGYYILADWLEIPNLRDRSNKLLKNLVCEHGLGMEVQPEPYMESSRMLLFISYAVLSYIYRWVVTFSILYFLSNWLKPYKLGSLSMLLALAALGSMIGWPIYRLFKGLSKRGRFPDMKRKNVTISALILASLLFVFFLVPLPISRVRQSGLVQVDSLLQQRVFVPDEGRLDVLHVQNGQFVNEGQLLAEFSSPKLEAEKLESEGQRDQYLAQMRSDQLNARAATDPDYQTRFNADARKDQSLADEAQSKAKNIQWQLDRLRNVRAPCAGVVMNAPKTDEVGKNWEKDQPLPFCTIGDPKSLRALVPVPPSDYHLLQSDMADGRTLAVSIRVPGRGSDIIEGRIKELPASDAKDIPMPLTHRGGGPLAVKPSNDPNVNVPQSQHYLVNVDILQPDVSICPGTVVKVKIHCKWQTGAWWCWHAISSAFDLGLI
jgi:putative peptide zinc metalloprotease protein